MGGRREWSRALILGIDCQDIAIVGASIIDGGKVHDPAGEEHMRGPHAILLLTPGVCPKNHGTKYEK